MLLGNAQLCHVSHAFLPVTDEKATYLLPLAEEYQIEQLKGLCGSELEKCSRPRLEYVSVAIRYNLQTLLSKAIDSCARKLSLTEIDKQQTRPENKEINDTIIIKILR